MKVLTLYDYPPAPGGLATQGDLLYKGLLALGVDAHAVHFESAQEKEWYYRWFEPDIVVGVGYWGHTPHLILHPQRYGARPVPWLVADGYIANYMDVLNKLPLILVTSNWVKATYVRDGVKPDNIHVLPVGCDTDTFIPREMSDVKISSVREALGVAPDQLMILTVGGDAASKGAQEVMHALALVDQQLPDWKYVCKVWPQDRTSAQNLADSQLATNLGIEKNVVYTTNKTSRNFMPYLIGASDIYAAPSRLEGFGMPQVEAGACGKPVISIKAMAMLDTLVHGETALLAGVAQEILLSETILGEESGYEPGHRVVFNKPRTADYRASIYDIADHLLNLMTHPELRKKMGEAGRKRVVEKFDYRVVAKKFVEIVSQTFHELMGRFVVRGETQHRHVHEGLVLPHLPYYAMSSYKIYRNDRFDLLGNSLAILTGLTAPSRADALISWIEKECEDLRIKGDLTVALPPVLFPYIQPTDPDWRPRYDKYNRPGEYHNGGIWPYVCGFYVAALVKAGHMKMAKERFTALTHLCRLSTNPDLDFGFNEWVKAQRGTPAGQDWQTWSAAMYLNAAACVDKGKAVFFE